MSLEQILEEHRIMPSVSPTSQPFLCFSTITNALWIVLELLDPIFISPDLSRFSLPDERGDEVYSDEIRADTPSHRLEKGCTLNVSDFYLFRISPSHLL